MATGPARVYVLFFLLDSISLYTESSPACTWPKFFDVSKKGWPIKVEERSWETETKINEVGFVKINGHPKARKAISIWNNHTLDIITFVGGDQKSKRYICAKDFGNNKFALKNTGLYDIEAPSPNAPASYRCMQLYQKSQFVLQWRIGPESTNIYIDCPEDFAQVSSWPLVHFPVRETSPISTLNKYHSLLEKYTPCPPEGGFIMTVKSSKGVPLDQSCSAVPARLEIECASGEGILFTEPSICDLSGMISGIGSKLFCLGSWEEGNYRFRVLIPAGAHKINGFHCLRVNKDDPTLEEAILFLDNVCLVTQPDANEHAFLRLQLKQKTIASVCDDYKSGCDANSDCAPETLQRNECFSTCSPCPAENEGIESEENLRGTWLLQRKGSVEEVMIDAENFTLPGLGSFKALGTPSAGCIPAPSSLKEGAAEYVLVQTKGDTGCVPRVSQIRMKPVANSNTVALMQIVGTAPLRSQFSSNITEWCKTNYVNAQKFAPLFSPYWPFSSLIEPSYEQGFYTVIRKDVSEKVSCRLDSKSLKYAANMQVKIELNTEEKVHSCNGKAHTVGTDWSLEFHTCSVNNETRGEFHFHCLANYEASERYHALTLAKQPEKGPSDISLPYEYYCLLIPKAEHNNLPIILNNAGECDGVFASWVIENERKPVAKITFIETIAQIDKKDKEDKNNRGGEDGSNEQSGGDGSREQNSGDGPSGPSGGDGSGEQKGGTTESHKPKGTATLLQPLRISLMYGLAILSIYIIYCDKYMPP